MYNIQFINRPNDEYNLGTGVSSSFFWLKLSLKKSNKFNIFECKKIFNITPFKTIKSILIYDYINPLISAFRNRKVKFDYLVFIDPAQTFFICIIKKILNKPKTIVIIHDLFFLEYNDLYHRYIKILYKISIKFSDYIITTTEENKKLIESNFSTDLKITILPFGVTIENNKIFKNIFKDNLYNNTIKIGYLGASTKRKRIEKIIDLIIFLKNYNINLLLFLAGPIQNMYINKFKILKSNKFNFFYYGVINEKKKLDFYNTIDLFFFPTKLEGYGLPILESFYLKKPCIVFKDAIIPKIFKQRCWLLDNQFKNIDNVLKKIKKLKNNNINTINEINDNYEYTKKFNWENYVNFFVNKLNNK